MARKYLAARLLTINPSTNAYPDYNDNESKCKTSPNDVLDVGDLEISGTSAVEQINEHPTISAEEEKSVQTGERITDVGMTNSGHDGREKKSQCVIRHDVFLAVDDEDVQSDISNVTRENDPLLHESTSKLPVARKAKYCVSFNTIQAEDNNDLPSQSYAKTDCYEAVQGELDDLVASSSLTPTVTASFGLKNCDPAFKSTTNIEHKCGFQKRKPVERSISCRSMSELKNKHHYILWINLFIFFFCFYLQPVIIQKYQNVPNQVQHH
jgi:hypothetical protein